MEQFGGALLDAKIAMEVVGWRELGVCKVHKHRTFDVRNCTAILTRLFDRLIHCQMHLRVLSRLA